MDFFFSNLNQLKRFQIYLLHNKNYETADIFQEFYTSITQIEKLLAPNLNLSSNKSLFSLLMETLDEKMINTLLTLKLTHFPAVVSLNMNVDTVLSEAFDKLVKAVPYQLIIEFQISDILHRLPMYREACLKLHTRLKLKQH